MPSFISYGCPTVSVALEYEKLLEFKEDIISRGLTICSLKLWLGLDMDQVRRDNVLPCLLEILKLLKGNHRSIPTLLKGNHRSIPTFSFSLCCDNYFEDNEEADNAGGHDKLFISNILYEVNALHLCTDLKILIDQPLEGVGQWEQEVFLSGITRNTNLNELTIEGTKFLSEGDIRALSHVLKSNNTLLDTLWLYHYSDWLTEAPELARELSHCVARNQSLTDLQLADHHFPLLKILKTTETLVDLTLCLTEFSNYPSLSWSLLHEGFTENQTLKKVSFSLRYNDDVASGISDSTLADIIAPLANHPSIEELIFMSVFAGAAANGDGVEDGMENNRYKEMDLTSNAINTVLASTTTLKILSLLTQPYSQGRQLKWNGTLILEGLDHNRSLRKLHCSLGVGGFGVCRVGTNSLYQLLFHPTLESIICDFTTADDAYMHALFVDLENDIINKEQRRITPINVLFNGWNVNFNGELVSILDTHPEIMLVECWTFIPPSMDYKWDDINERDRCLYHLGNLNCNGLYLFGSGKQDEQHQQHSHVVPLSLWPLVLSNFRGDDLFGFEHSSVLFDFMQKEVFLNHFKNISACK